MTRSERLRLGRGLIIDHDQNMWLAEAVLKDGRLEWSTVTRPAVFSRVLDPEDYAQVERLPLLRLDTVVAGMVRGERRLFAYAADGWVQPLADAAEAVDAYTAGHRLAVTARRLAGIGDGDEPTLAGDEFDDGDYVAVYAAAPDGTEQELLNTDYINVHKRVLLPTVEPDGSLGTVELPHAQLLYRSTINFRNTYLAIPPKLTFIVTNLEKGSLEVRDGTEPIVKQVVHSGPLSDLGHVLTGRLAAKLRRTATTLAAHPPVDLATAQLFVEARRRP